MITYKPSGIWPGQLWTDDERDYRVTCVSDDFATLHDVDGRGARREPILPDGLTSKLGALRWLHWDDPRYLKAIA